MDCDLEQIEVKHIRIRFRHREVEHTDAAQLCSSTITSVAEMGTSTTPLVVGVMMFLGRRWFFTIPAREIYVFSASCQDMQSSTYRVVTLSDIG